MRSEFLVGDSVLINPKYKAQTCVLAPFDLVSSSKPEVWGTEGLGLLTLPKCSGKASGA